MNNSIEPKQKTVAECAADFADIVDEVHQSHRSVVITKDDKPQAVLVEWEAYVKYRETVKLAFLLGEAEADRKAGNYVSVEECFAELQCDGRNCK